ncbi:MAG: hypothetical protein MJ033_01715 [Victivallaceae bacterium]|nr:hypothetical protein [Victivallaceae bacterium]
MISVWLREWRQTMHRKTLTGFAALLIFFCAVVIAARFCGKVLEEWILLCHAGIFLLCVSSVVLAARRWKRESGDPALDMNLTTALPELQIVCGKFCALYLPIVVLLILDQAVDHPKLPLRLFALDIAFFAALASVTPALASLRKARSRGFNWSGFFVFFIAFPFMLEHLVFRGRCGGFLLNMPDALFYRCIIQLLFLTFAGFLIALAGMKHPGEERMRDLHVFCLFSTLALPLLYVSFGAENWRCVQSETWMTAAKFFLLASLFERGKVTARQKRSWRFPLFATGSIFVWAWSILLTFAAYFISPCPENALPELGNWFFFGLYIALVRCCTPDGKTLRRTILLLIVWIAAAFLGSFAPQCPDCSRLSMAYFDYFPFDRRFFGIVFAVSIALRAKEIWQFCRSVIE